MLTYLLGTLFIVVLFYYLYRESKKIFLGFPYFGERIYPIPVNPLPLPPRKPAILANRTKLPRSPPLSSLPTNVKMVITDTPAPLEPRYLFKIKSPQSLTPAEYNTLQEFWEKYLKQDSFFKEADMGFKDNALVFLASVIENGAEHVIGQANLLILDQHDIYGFFSKLGHLNLDLNAVILYNVCVDPNYRRLGIAKQLLVEIDEWSCVNNKKKIILFVKPNNQGAINLYEKSGYTVDKTYFPVSGNQNDEYLLQKRF